MVLYPDMRRRRLSELSALLVPIVMLTAVMLWMTHEATLRVSVIMREESQARKVLFSADGVSIGSGGRNLNKMRSKNKDEVRRTTFVVRDWPAVTKKLSTLERRDREFGAIFEEHWQAQKNRSSDPYEANYFLIRHDGVKIGDHGHSLPLNDSFEFNCGGKKHMKLVVSHGFYWKKVAKVHGSHMYSLDKNPYVLLNLSGSGVPRCVGRLGDRSTWEIAHPPMVVSLTGSIWLDANGRAYSCETTGLVVAWELGAGCCTEDWTPLSDKTVVNVPDGHHLQFQSVFSLLQWHGSSPYHIIFEVSWIWKIVWLVATGLVQSASLLIFLSFFFGVSLVFPRGRRKWECRFRSGAAETVVTLSIFEGAPGDCGACEWSDDAEVCRRHVE